MKSDESREARLLERVREALQHQLWRNHDASTSCSACAKTIDLLNDITNGGLLR